MRFGMTKLSSSRLIGLDSPERGREVDEGAIMFVLILYAPLAQEEAIEGCLQ